MFVICLLLLVLVIAIVVIGGCLVWMAQRTAWSGPLSPGSKASISLQPEDVIIVHHTAHVGKRTRRTLKLRAVDGGVEVELDLRDPDQLIAGIRSGVDWLAS